MDSCRPFRQLEMARSDVRLCTSFDRMYVYPPRRSSDSPNCRLICGESESCTRDVARALSQLPIFTFPFLLKGLGQRLAHRLA